MRRPAALMFAVLLLFPVIPFLHSQTQSDQTAQPTGSQKSAETEKSQPSDKAQSSAAKPESAQKQQNPFDQFQQFSATVSGGPLRWDNMKVYRSGSKFRADHDYEKEIRVSDLSKHAGWLMRHWENRPEKCGPTDKMDIASFPFFAYTGKGYKVERVQSAEAAEKETINEHPTKIEHYTVKKTDDGTLVAKVKLWEAEDLNGFPVRMEIDPPATKLFYLYYTNVKLERPDPKLFEVPAKCLKKTGSETSSQASPKSKSSKSKSPQSDKSTAPPQ